MKQTLLGFVTTLLMAFSCEPGEQVVPAQAGQLSGNWKLVAPASDYAVTLNVVTDPLVQTTANSVAVRLSGRSAVNQYFANATFALSDARQATVGVLGATEMAGPPEAMRFEGEYFTRLQAVGRYELTDRNRLRLHYVGEQPGTLVYEKIE